MHVLYCWSRLCLYLASCCHLWQVCQPLCLVRRAVLSTIPCTPVPRVACRHWHDAKMGRTAEVRSQPDPGLQSEAQPVPWSHRRVPCAGGSVLALAFRDTAITSQAEADDTTAEQLERDLTLIALVGIQDPLRSEVIPAIEQCHRAGITVRMLTGGPPKAPLCRAGVHAWALTCRPTWRTKDVTHCVLNCFVPGALCAWPAWCASQTRKGSLNAALRLT